MSKNGLTLFAENVLSILQIPVKRHNDFINLAIAGEHLRGALEAAKGSHPAAERALRKYNLALRSYRGPAPYLWDLRTDFLATFLLISELPPRKIEIDDEMLFSDLVDLTCLVVALVRADRASWSDAEILLDEVLMRVRRYQKHLRPFSWNAQHKLLAYCQDKNFPTAYNWLKEVAGLTRPRRSAAR